MGLTPISRATFPRWSFSMSEPRLPGMDALLRPETTRARLSAESSQVAVRLVGDMLVRAECVEPRYVDAMARVLRELGPYAVLAPGAVLLHARPEDGVRRACLGLVTLTGPVEFGHRDNDPVDLVFALGAVDHDGHLQALRELAVLLMDEPRLAEVRAAADDETLLAALRSVPITRST